MNECNELESVFHTDAEMFSDFSRAIFFWQYSVVIEEAAEVLEAHVVTSLSPSCQHLILIGNEKCEHRHSSSNQSLQKILDRWPSAAKTTYMCLSTSERLPSGRITVRKARQQRNETLHVECSASYASWGGPIDCPFHLPDIKKPQFGSWVSRHFGNARERFLFGAHRERNTRPRRKKSSESVWSRSGLGFSPPSFDARIRSEYDNGFDNVLWSAASLRESAEESVYVATSPDFDRGQFSGRREWYHHSVAGEEQWRRKCRFSTHCQSHMRCSVACQKRLLFDWEYERSRKKQQIMEPNQPNLESQ